MLWHTGLVAPRHGDLPGPGIEPRSPALAGRFLTTAPPGKSGFTLDVAYSVGLDKCIMTCIHPYRITQSIFTPLCSLTQRFKSFTVAYVLRMN